MFNDREGFTKTRGSTFGEYPGINYAFENWVTKWDEITNTKPIDIELIIDFENKEWFIDDKRIGEVYTEEILGLSFIPTQEG